MGSTTLRQRILDGLETLLSASTGIKDASLDLESFHEIIPHQFPRVEIVDRGCEIKRLAFPHASAEDMEALLRVDLIGYVYDQNNVLDRKRENLYMDIAKTVESTTTTWSGLVKDAKIVGVEQDPGAIDNIGVITCKAEIWYMFNHGSP